MVTSGDPVRLPPRSDPQGAPWPGLIPLRPLGYGEIYLAAARLVRRNALVLCGVSLLLGLVTAVATLSFLANRSDLPRYLDPATGDGSVLTPVVLWPLAIGLFGAFAAATLLSALTTVLAAEESVGRRPTRSAVLARMQGRWWIVLVVGLLSTVAVLAGLALLLLPGLVAMALLTLSVPIAVMEGGSVPSALRRSIRLSGGLLSRVLGVLALQLLISSSVSALLSGLLAAADPAQDWTSEVAGQLFGAAVAAVITPWSAAVVSVLYIDTRIRQENLAPALIAAAARQG